jgi:hypothetical protein
MSERLTIVVDVSGDRLTEDPHDVAEELIADAIDKGDRYAESRTVRFVGAEWGGPKEPWA